MEWLLVQDLQHLEVLARHFQPPQAFVCKGRAIEPIVDLKVVITIEI